MNVVLYIFFVLKVEAILNRRHLKQAFFQYKIAVQTNEGDRKPSLLGIIRL